MKKFLYFFIFVFVLFCFCFSEKESIYKKEVLSKIPYKSVYFTQVAKTYFGENCSIENFKIWVKNEKIRSEKSNQDGTNTIISIIDTKTQKAYVYTAGKKKGMLINLKENDKALEFFFGDSLRASAQKIGTGKYNGEKCDIYEYFYSITMFGMTAKYKVTEWRNKDGFVLKTQTEEIETDNEKKQPSTIEVLSYKKNPIINNNIFELPKDVVFEDYNKLFSVFSSDNKSEKKVNNTKNVQKNSDSIKKNKDNAINKDEEISKRTEEDTESEEPTSENRTEKNIQDKIVEETTKKAAESIINNLFGR